MPKIAQLQQEGNNGLRTLDFQGHPIRIIDQMVPVNDIAEATGRKRRGVQELVLRDPVLKEMAVERDTRATDGKIYPVSCLPYEGALLLLAKMNANRSASKEARGTLITFQRWAGSTLKVAMFGDLVHPGAEVKGLMVDLAHDRDEARRQVKQLKAANARFNEIREKRMLINALNRGIRDPWKRHAALHAAFPEWIPEPNAKQDVDQPELPFEEEEV